MSEKRIGLKTESQMVVRVTADGLLNEALWGLEDDSQQVSRKLFLQSLKGFFLSKNPDKYEIDETVRFRDGVRGLSGVGETPLELTDYLKPIHSGGVNGPIVGVHFGLDLSPWRTREVIIAPPFFGPRFNDNAERAAEAQRIKHLAERLNYLPLLYKIEHPSAHMDDAINALQATLKAGAFVTELMLIPNTPDALSEDYFPHRPVPERSPELLRELISLYPASQPPVPIDIDTKRNKNGTTQTAS